MRIVPVRGGGVDKAVPGGVELRVQLTRRFVVGRGGEAPPPLRTFFYVDALNLYYGALRGGFYRWPDIAEFCAAALKQNPHFNEKKPSTWRPALPLIFKKAESAFNAARIKIFTAKLKKMPWDPKAPKRQANYLRALQAYDAATAKLIDIHYGVFEARQKKRRIAEDFNSECKVILPEEKGSDVNPALHMLKDAYEKECECAVLISNDTDLKTALKMVRERKILVGVVFPVVNDRHPAATLKENADFYTTIRRDNISSVGRQLPKTVVGAKGERYCRPPERGAPCEAGI